MSERRIPTLAAVALLSGFALLGCTAPTTVAPTEDVPTTGDAITTDSGGDCLVGEWIIPEDQLNAFYAQISAESEGVSMSAEGDSALIFTETTYEYRPDFKLILDLGGTTGRGDVTGSVLGNYTAADGLLTTENDVSDLDMQLVIDGMPIDANDIGNAAVESEPIHDVTYHCEAGAPVIDFKTVDSTIALTLVAG